MTFNRAFSMLFAVGGTAFMIFFWVAGPTPWDRNSALTYLLAHLCYCLVMLQSYKLYR